MEYHLAEGHPSSQFCLPLHSESMLTGIVHRTTFFHILQTTKGKHTHAHKMNIRTKVVPMNSLHTQ